MIGWKPGDRILRVLYLYSGEPRKASLANALDAIKQRHQCTKVNPRQQEMLIKPMENQ